jgi:molybdopterin/thiamine biosynthesis adenylyltransferase
MVQTEIYLSGKRKGENVSGPRTKFHHEEILRGKDLTKKLGKLVTVCGCGAIGSNLLENLARQGFSNLRVVDMDRVETHNINTQTFTEKDIGAYKGAAVQRHVFDAVGVEIQVFGKELTASTAKKFLKGSDLVVDGFDNTKSRQLVRDFCQKQNIPCLHVGLHAEYSEVVWDERYTVPQDNDEDVCDYPLARNLIMLTVGMASEEIVDFFLAKKPRRRNWSLTLKDLKIGPY